MNQWSTTTRRWAVAIAVCCSVAWSLLTHSLFDTAFAQPDSLWYIALAEGQPVTQLPFAYRQLGPAVVRGAAHVLHCSVITAFHLQGGFCLCLVLWVVYALAARTAAPLWLLAAMIPLPFWSLLLAGLYLPDLWFAALLAVMIWLLHKEQFLFAALMLLPLMASRESTILVAVCLLVAAWRPLCWAGRVAIVLATIAGAAVARCMIHGHAANREDISQALYLMGKVPWNFVRNMLDLSPWSNRYTLLCATPKWSMVLWPGSSIRVGLCPAPPLVGPLHFGSPLLLFFLYGSVFSLLTMITTWCWWKARASRKSRGWYDEKQGPMVSFCLLYGVLSLVLVPLLGTTMFRFVCYAWPLPLVALPALFSAGQARPADGRAAILLALCAADVVPMMTGMRLNEWGSFGCVCALNIAAFLLLRAHRKDTLPPASANPPQP